MVFSEKNGVTRDYVPVSVTIPPTLALAARIEAARQNVSRSVLVRRALERYLAEIQRQEPGQQPGTQNAGR